MAAPGGSPRAADSVEANLFKGEPPAPPAAPAQQLLVALAPETDEV